MNDLFHIWLSTGEQLFGLRGTAIDGYEIFTSLMRVENRTNNLGGEITVLTRYHTFSVDNPTAIPIRHIITMTEPLPEVIVWYNSSWKYATNIIGPYNIQVIKNVTAWLESEILPKEAPTLIPDVPVKPSESIEEIKEFKLIQLFPNSNTANNVH